MNIFALRPPKNKSKKSHLPSHPTVFQNDAPGDAVYLQNSKRHVSQSIPNLPTNNSESSSGTSPDTTTSNVEEPDFLNDEIGSLGKRKRFQTTESPFLQWIPLRDAYLMACMRLEGRGRQTKECNKCYKQNPQEWFRCDTCFGAANTCRTCALATHQAHPLHRMKVWEDDHWKPTDLRKIGVFVDFGHPPGYRCAMPSRIVDDFLVIHTDGPHYIRARFCGCRPRYPDYDQILDSGWWPATVDTPKTAITNDSLRLFDKVNGRGRITTYQWCESLLDLYNPRGLLSPPFIYESFKLAQREYRHVKLLKRSGRAYFPEPTKGIQPGELALQCRACPQDITIPLSLNSIPRELWFLYTLFLSEDGNFRAKARDRSNNVKDPSLNAGSSYVAEHDQYLKTIKDIPCKQETSHCSGFDAMALVNAKRSKGLRATGVGMVLCSRHGMVRPQGMGDLQVGERYRNMDYIFLRSVMGARIHKLVMSYDISCQWDVNLWLRMLLFPSEMHLTVDKEDVECLVPKWHLAAHNERCQADRSSNYRKGCGRLDGESTERFWSGFNQIASSAKELGPGARHDLFDIYIDHHNFRKYKTLESSMFSRLKKAITSLVAQSRAFQEFDGYLQEKNPELVASWEVMVCEWEEDSKKPNPFVCSRINKSMIELRAELIAREEINSPATPISLKELQSPSVFLWEIFDIEKCLISLEHDTSKGETELTPSERLSIKKRRNEVTRRRNKVELAQCHHMPGLAPWLESEAGQEALKAEKKGGVKRTKLQMELQKLWPPSAFADDVRAELCSHSLSAMEAEMREAFAFEKLEDLRTHLRTRTASNHFKKGNLTGQRAHTKSYNFLATVERKIQLAASLYRHSYQALCDLDIPGKWNTALQPLLNSHLVGLNERVVSEQEHNDFNEMFRRFAPPTHEINTVVTMASTVNLGEGQRVMSWIWHHVSAEDIRDDADGSLHDSVRTEWCKARARYHRWKEEVLLLDEEMRRVIEYGKWKAQWWADCIQGLSLPLPPSSPTHSGPLASPDQVIYLDRLVEYEGLVAYAREQQLSEEAFRIQVERRWCTLRESAREALRDQERLFATKTSDHSDEGVNLVMELEDDFDDADESSEEEDDFDD